MSKRRSRDLRRDGHGHIWEIAASLWDGPRTVDEIVAHFHSYTRFLGFFCVVERLAHSDHITHVKETVENLIDRGWVVRQGERYALTALGRGEAKKVFVDMRRTRRWLRKFVQPQTVSKVAVGVHLGLAGLKLPAGLLSGSVGLLNDAADTLLDGLSSLLVYAGFRFHKERAANAVLVIFMLGTGGFTLYEALRRFFIPFEPEVDWFAFLVAILSAGVCAVLWGYQRFVGLRSESIALITQSVDSRNHVIVAASVTVGLIAAVLHFSLLDTLVGLVVAILILKSAVELGRETLRSLGGEEVDFSRYKVGIVERYGQFRQAQLRDWMLYLVEKRQVQTRTELIARVKEALDFSKNPILRELGLVQQQTQTDGLIEQSMMDLFERGWLIGEEQLNVTDTAREYLGRRMGRLRHRLFTER